MFRRLQKIGLACALKKLKHAIFLDRDTKTIVALHGAYEYLERYSYVVKQQALTWKVEPARKVIWTCWLQGIDRAPLLVKKCVSSMRQYAGDYEVVVIDAQNVSQYIELPDYIHDKYRKGIIPPAHYSDVIRLALLNRYGGVWIDSTIMLTDCLPNYILQAEFFAFRGEHSMGHSGIYNPFFASKPHHPLVNAVLEMLLVYWREENKLVSYSIMHLFFSIAIEATPQNQQLWEQVPYSFGGQIFYLQRQLGKPYNEQAYQLATQMSSIHKLTYKFDEYHIDPDKKGTFYDILINGNKPC